jgi:hypothetical protein
MRQEEDTRGRGEDAALEEGEEVLLRPGDLPPIWKPEAIGEAQVGELLSIKKLPFGDVLRLRTAAGIIAIPQSVAMAEIDFREMIGRRLRFVFKGAVDTKSGNKVKLFQISVAKKSDDEDVPF